MTEETTIKLPQFSAEYFMRLALKQAEEGAKHGEVPVGAIVTFQNRVIARAYNQVEMLKDGTAHAEMLALTQASAAIHDWRLNKCTLYVTKEPCVMCAGAMVNCRLGTLYYGCSDPRMGGAGGALSVTAFPGMLHHVETHGGLLAEPSAAILQDFFKQRRRIQKGSH